MQFDGRLVKKVSLKKKKNCTDLMMDVLVVGKGVVVVVLV